MDPSLFLADLERKPSVLRATADLIRRGGAAWPVRRPPDRVLLIGMGSSLYAAQVCALRLRAAGITAIAESGAAESTLAVGSDDLVVGITAGGSSVETNRLFATCAAARRIALTNTGDSEITVDADNVVPMRAGDEAGGVACRSFTNTLIHLLVLEQQLTGQALDLARRVTAAADATEELMSRRDDWLDPVIDLTDGPHGTWLLAPAERISSAMQGALMLREGPRRPAVGCETGDWSHVDVYLTKTLDYRAIVFPGSRWDAQAIAWMTERGSRVLAVGAGSDGGDLPGAEHTIRYECDDDPLVALLTETLVPEMAAATMWARVAA